MSSEEGAPGGAGAEAPQAAGPGRACLLGALGFDARRAAALEGVTSGGQTPRIGERLYEGSDPSYWLVVM